MGWAVELTTLLGNLKGHKKCNAVLWVKTCIDKVTLVCRKAIKVEVCLVFDGNNMVGMVGKVRIVFLEQFDDVVEAGMMVFANSIRYSFMLVMKIALWCTAERFPPETMEVLSSVFPLWEKIHP